MTAGFFLLLPSMTADIDYTSEKRIKIPLLPMLKRKDILISYSIMAIMSFGHFMLFAGTIIYFVFNLGFPREDLEILYTLGGCLSFIAMMMTGQIVDRVGARMLSFIITVLYVIVLADWYLHPPVMSLTAVFCLFMMCAAIMGVICSSIASEVPGEKERAAYMSLQRTTRHLAAGLGGVVSSIIMTSNPDGSLNNIDILASVSIGCIMSLPVLVLILRRSLSMRGATV